MPDSNAKTAATYLAELNGNAQDVSDWVLDLAARCDAAEAELARCRPVVEAAALRWANDPGDDAACQPALAKAVAAYERASPAATKAERRAEFLAKCDSAGPLPGGFLAVGEPPSIYGPAEDACGPVIDPEHLRVNVGVVDAEQRPRSPLSDEVLGEVARKAEMLAVARSGEPHVDACNSMARAVREAIEASQSSDGALPDCVKRWQGHRDWYRDECLALIVANVPAKDGIGDLRECMRWLATASPAAIEASQAPAADEGAVVLADRASGDIAILSHHQNGSTVDSQRLWMAQQSATIISRYELTAWLIQPRVSWRLEDYDVWMSGAPDFVKALIRDA